MLSTKTFVALLLVAVATLAAADVGVENAVTNDVDELDVDENNDSRTLVDLECDDGEVLVIDEECLAEAEEDRDNAFDASQEIFEEAIEAAEARARRKIQKADDKLRNRVTTRKIRKNCRLANNFNRCARNYIASERRRFNRREEKALNRLTRDEQEARDDRAAARRAARRTFRRAEEDCCSCVEVSMRF